MNFDQLPTTAPKTPVLDRIADAGHEIASLNDEELVHLANELREFLLYSVSTTGGHFGAGLGVVELTIALHHVFNT
ncbi:MAG: 1-deoxy-D-xylulose-5-phosphate synthase N-terminal domain-containing protein, partial [Luminiphilus sp.]|nr:1-deoxy-D-xylulose-5-phosphate synthase N-terminal domain-containing protein [Luminiphilus sp.]